MRHENPLRMEVRDLRQQAAMARLRAEQAGTTQEQLHFQGMADYWEELIREKEHGASE